jgi:hypothetical protein
VGDPYVEGRAERVDGDVILYLLPGQAKASVPVETGGIIVVRGAGVGAVRGWVCGFGKGEEIQREDVRLDV